MRVNGKYHTDTYITDIESYGYYTSRRTWLVGSDLGYSEIDFVSFDQVVWC